MIIGLVIEFLPEAGRKLGGVTVAVHRLANGFIRAGHEVVVVAMNEAPSDALYKVHSPFRSKLIRKFLGTQVGLQFYSLLLNFCNFPKADIWHFHGYDHFLLKKVRPRIRTLHGSSCREMQFSESLPRKFLMLCNYCWEHISIARADRMLCIGQETADHFGLTHVVDNPFDPSVFRPSEKFVHPKIFYNGYWSGRKRGWFMYRIFVEKVLPRFPNAELVMLCNDVPEHPNVTVLSGITDAELANAYSTSWLFCYPSLYEGFGMAYMEAMASGTAILSSPNSGADYVLDGGKFAVISDDSHFASALIELIANPEKRLTLEQLGLQRCRNFTVDAVVKQHLAHYEEVINVKNF